MILLICPSTLRTPSESEPCFRSVANFLFRKAKTKLKFMKQEEEQTERMKMYTNMENLDKLQGKFGP